MLESTNPGRTSARARMASCHLRSDISFSGSPLLLWTDAICINQADETTRMSKFSACRRHTGSPAASSSGWDTPPSDAKAQGVLDAHHQGLADSCTRDQRQRTSCPYLGSSHALLDVLDRTDANMVGSLVTRVRELLFRFQIPSRTATLYCLARSTYPDALTELLADELTST
jgi:hypothetical protein